MRGRDKEGDDYCSGMQPAGGKFSRYFHVNSVCFVERGRQVAVCE